MNRKTIIILVVVVVALVIAAVVKKQNSSDAQKVTAEAVELRKIVETVSANGKVQPELEVKISPDVSGEVIELTVKEGDSVKQGDLLVRINPDIYEAALSRAEASLNSIKATKANSNARLAQSKAQLINAEAAFKRQEELFEQGVVSPSDFDQSKANVEVARADVIAAEESVKGAEFNVKSAEAGLKEAKDNLKRTTILSPISGTISKLDIEQGERVVGTSQMAGTEMLRIADLTGMEVDVEVNESDIVKVKLGDEADIEVDAYVDRVFKGVVTEIANSSASSGVMSTEQVTVFNVKVHILESSYSDLIDPEKPHMSPFRPGMSATVEVKTGAVDEAVTVPIQAVTIRADSVKKSKYGKINLDDVEDEDLKTCVFVIKDNVATRKFVTTGMQDTRFIQIVSGLEKGEMVVTGPYAYLTTELVDGDEVEAADKEAVYEKED